MGKGAHFVLSASSDWSVTCERSASDVSSSGWLAARRALCMWLLGRTAFILEACWVRAHHGPARETGSRVGVPMRNVT